MDTYSQNPCLPTPDEFSHQDAQCPDGGEPPRLVTRGETNTTTLLSPDSPGKILPFNDIAHIDWLAFTFKGDGSPQEHLSFQNTLERLFNIPASVWEGTKSGWNGYDKRANLGPYGLLAYGGKSQNNTTHIEINGHGCGLVTNWEAIYQWGMETNSIITRCDLAHDDFQGETININICRGWYSEGLFNSNGRPPKPFLYDDCDTGDGKTFTVGSRKNGKMARMYEKGKEQGDPNDPWFRIELELRNKDRIIPWDIILRPSLYLAGAYEAFKHLSIEQAKIKTIQKQSNMNYEQTVDWLRISAGKALNLVLQENGGDVSALFDLVVRDGIPKRLEPYFKSGKP